MLYLPILEIYKTLMQTRTILLQSIAGLLSLFLAAPGGADTLPHYDSPELAVGLMPRTPQQIAAFYEARGFSKPMVERLKQQCFITVWVHNKSQNIIWLDLARWKFSTPTSNVTRRDRHYWKAIWSEMQIPLAHQSTFRWTLLPEILDFQPEEREGGNIILPRSDEPMQIHASFPTRADKSGVPLTVIFNNIECAKDP